MLYLYLVCKLNKNKMILTKFKIKIILHFSIYY